MYTLYFAPGAASMLPHLVLLETGAAHRLEKVDTAAGAQRSPEYLKLNPAGVVPTLVEDGRAMAESAAIAMLVAERHPESGLVPPPGDASRATFLSWTFALANTLQPTFRHWWYPAEAAGEANIDAAKAQTRTKIEKFWDRLDAHLAANGPYIAGAKPTLADLYATMLMRWSRNMPKPALEWPHLKALADRVRARPSWKTLYEREGLTEWA
ncbi:MAG TPA: glutathione S-transferase family protein [Xanthomonadales bacterium]|nr:glutathione S-transferase family protein [Xanthomonadales bacterium]